jgi:hypothetical protein
VCFSYYSSTKSSPRSIPIVLAVEWEAVCAGGQLIVQWPSVLSRAVFAWQWKNYLSSVLVRIILKKIVTDIDYSLVVKHHCIYIQINGCRLRTAYAHLVHYQISYLLLKANYSISKLLYIWIKFVRLPRKTNTLNYKTYILHIIIPHNTYIRHILYSVHSPCIGDFQWPIIIHAYLYYLLSIDYLSLQQLWYYFPYYVYPNPPCQLSENRSTRRKLATFSRALTDSSHMGPWRESNPRYQRWKALALTMRHRSPTPLGHSIFK